MQPKLPLSQVICMVTCEFLFFLFWEQWTVTHGGMLLVFAETTNLLYFDAIILPYLILNGKIKSQLRAMMKGNTAVIHVTDTRV
ncbi:hypothetical protein Q1695_002363 [Nippostrongylus brasiliensis]|nr:hypothetical protein Q1695_002363 [Nippostrongylus brasiliensis]